MGGEGTRSAAVLIGGSAGAVLEAGDARLSVGDVELDDVAEVLPSEGGADRAIAGPPEGCSAAAKAG
jgi:hypothetical protein